MTQRNRPPLSSTQPPPQKTAQGAAITAYAEAKLRKLEARDLRRVLKPTKRTGPIASRAGDELLSFSDNDYLGLSNHPAVIEAGVAAAKTYGAGAGAARLVTGETPLNQAVEAKLAKLKGCEDALIFGSGYLANVGAIPALVGKGDLIVMDELSHSCIHAGARLSGAQIGLFRHNDVEHARALLSEAAPGTKKLVVTETIFSMDGDRAPLRALFDLCEATGAWLMTDDAHGLGLPGIDNPAPIQMGTLSKAAGVYGGYVCGPPMLKALLINRARSFVYTTGLPPFVLGAVNAALDIIATEPGLGERAIANARLFCALANLPTPTSAIVPLIVGEAPDALALSTQLQLDGFLVAAIRPPTVPEGTARLRIAFSAAHEAQDIRRFAAVVNDALNAEGRT